MYSVYVYLHSYTYSEVMDVLRHKGCVFLASSHSHFQSSHKIEHTAAIERRAKTYMYNPRSHLTFVCKFNFRTAI